MALLTASPSPAQRPLNWNVLRITVQELAERTSIASVRSRKGQAASRRPHHADSVARRFSFFTGFVLNALRMGDVLGLPPMQRVIALATS